MNLKSNEEQTVEDGETVEGNTTTYDESSIKFPWLERSQELVRHDIKCHFSIYRDIHHDSSKLSTDEMRQWRMRILKRHHIRRTAR